ncbi:MAG: hypothetical protein ASARMPRED_003377 [Alectoria sarmentosa]|nr:MAG: hypothetical protein ASARMPRED_003377 [Alectoria sarmentosa]
MVSLASKVISITGSASGMGFVTAKALFDRGVSLSFADYREDALIKTQFPFESSFVSTSSQKPTILATALHIRESSQVKSRIEKTVSHFGRLDGAAIIAGALGKNFGVHDLTQLSNEEWEFVTRTDFTGLSYCMRAQLRVLSDGGAVVNAASTTGLESHPKNSANSATKHAVNGLSKSAAGGMGGRGSRPIVLRREVYSFAHGCQCLEWHSSILSWLDRRPLFHLLSLRVEDLWTV